MKWITLVLAATLLVLQYNIWISDKGGSLRSRYAQVKQQVQAQQSQNEAAAKRNQELAAEVRDLREGYDSVTEIAREKLGYIKSGETFYRVNKN